MNWLDRARREIQESAWHRTGNTAERNLTAVTAVPQRGFCEKSRASIGSNGSTAPIQVLEIESMQEEFEERAAIMEFDGGLNRDEAERAAWALVMNCHRLH